MKAIKLTIFLTILTVLFTRQANAQTETSPLTVAPARQQITTDPGKTETITVKFLNQGSTPISGALKVADFIVEDKEGSPTFLEGPTALSQRFAAAAWVKLPYEKITIAPLDKVQIQAKITVPEDAAAGGRYFAIYFEPGGNIPETAQIPSEGVSAVSLRVAALVYLRVSGPIEENAQITLFEVPTFIEFGPIAVKTEIVNLGNYHIRPKGVLKLTNLITGSSQSRKMDEQNIFPDASRIFKTEIGQKWMLGKYKVEFQASYGETGRVLATAAYLWAFPVRIAIIVILSIVIIILLVRLVWTNLKKRQNKLEETLKQELSEVEELKEKYKDKIS